MKFIPGQASVLHDSTAVDNPLHSKPPKFASTSMFLIFVLSPPPQVLEHSPCSHSAHSQSTNERIDKKRIIYFKHSETKCQQLYVLIVNLGTREHCKIRPMLKILSNLFLHLLLVFFFFWLHFVLLLHRILSNLLSAIYPKCSQLFTTIIHFRIETLFDHFYDSIFGLATKFTFYAQC